MVSTIIKELLIKWDYQGLSLIPLDQAKSETEAYVILRALLVRGELSRVTNTLDLSPSHFVSPIGQSLAKLLRAQLAAIQNQKPLDALCYLIHFDLTQIEESFERSYLLGEECFTKGYVLMRACQFAQSVSHFSEAMRFYREAELPRQEGASCFNAYLSRMHLATRDSENPFFERLEALVESTSDPTLQAYLLRTQAYSALHLGDDNQAMQLLHQCIEAAMALGRAHDARVCRSYLAYLHLKAGEFDGFEKYSRQIQQDGVEDFVSQRIELFQSITGAPLLNQDQSVALVESAVNAGVDGISLVFAMSLCMEGMLRSKDYEGIAALFSRFLSESRRLEQAPDLVDFRSYVAIASFHLGDRANGIRFLTQIEEDAKTSGSKSKLELTSQLREQFRIPKSPTHIPVTSRKLIKIDTVRKCIWIQRKEISLRDHPMVFALIKAVSTSSQGLRLEDAFEACYQQEYNPLLHQSRFHSLIFRARKLFGSNDVIHWSDGWLQLSPEFDAVVLERETRKPA